MMPPPRNVQSPKYATTVSITSPRGSTPSTRLLWLLRTAAKPRMRGVNVRAMPFVCDWNSSHHSQFTPDAALYVGYRYIRYDIGAQDDLERDSSGHIGLRLRF